MHQILIYALAGLFIGSLIMACYAVRDKLIERKVGIVLRVLAMAATAGAMILAAAMVAAAIETWIL